MASVSFTTHSSEATFRGLKTVAKLAARSA